HQLVGEARIAARDLFGDQRKSLHLARPIELDAAQLFGHAERADADLLGPLQDFRRQPVLRRHRPFALPIAADEGTNDVVDQIAAALPHQALFFGKLGGHEATSVSSCPALCRASTSVALQSVKTW